MRFRFHPVPVLPLLLSGLLFLPGCGTDGEAGPQVRESHAELVQAVPADAWEGLLHPVAIARDEEARIYVGDRGDRTVKVFDSDGGPVREIGRFGPGPGELTDIQELVVLADEIVVSDPESARFVRYARDGAFLGIVPNPAMADAFGALGPDRIVVAASPIWAMEAAMGRGGGALFEVVAPTGAVELAGGERRPTANPFVGHIRNFVLPAGSRDGSFVWLARLNHPSVIRHALSGGETVTVERSVPFDWRELAADFEPTAELMARGMDATPPFDALALDITTDGSDRAFVLTPLAPTRSVGDASRSLAVDVLDPAAGWTHRIRIPGSATAVTVSPDGSRLYLLDETTARIRVYEWSDDE